jgi:hypothetical protein
MTPTSPATRRSRDWVLCALWMGYMAFVFDGGAVDWVVAVFGGVLVIVSILRDARDLRAARSR